MGAYLCTENKLETYFSSVAQSHGDAGGLRDWDFSEIWTNTHTSNVWVRHILTSGRTADTCIVWGQNAVNADDLVVYNGNNSVELGRINHLGKGEPCVFQLTEQTTTSYEVWPESSTNYSKGFRHIWLGDRIEIPEGISVGFTDPRTGRDISIEGSSSRSGHFIGLFSRPQPQEVQITLEFLEAAWINANWDAIADHITSKPFYFIPELSEAGNSAALLCWLRSPPTTDWVSGLCRRITLDCLCVRK